MYDPKRDWRACGYCPLFHGVWEIGCQNEDGYKIESKWVNSLVDPNSVKTETWLGLGAGKC